MPLQYQKTRRGNVGGVCRRAEAAGFRRGFVVSCQAHASGEDNVALRSGTLRMCTAAIVVESPRWFSEQINKFLNRKACLFQYRFKGFYVKNFSYMDRYTDEAAARPA